MTGGLRRSTPNFLDVQRLFFAGTFSLDGLRTDRITQPFKQHVWVYACIDAIAKNISGVDLQLFTGTRKDKRLIESGPLAKLLEMPNPMMSGQALIEAMLVYLGLAGEFILILDRDNIAQLPREIWCFDPRRFEHKTDPESGLISSWIYRNGSKTITLQDYEVLHARYFNPYNDYRGLSPLEAAAASVEQDWWAGQYNSAFFKNSAVPGGVIETKDPMDDPDYDRVRGQIESRHQGASKGHRIMILEGGAIYKTAGLSQKDMDFLEGRRFNREEILAAFKVPLHALGGVQEKFDSNAKARANRKLFWEDCLLPKMALIEFALWQQLFSKLMGGNVWAEFDRRNIAALQEDLGEKIEQGKSLWGMGVPFVQINEKLDLGFEEFPGWDQSWLPFNLQSTDQKSVPEPTPVKAVIIETIAPAALPAPEQKAMDLERYWENYIKLHDVLEKKVQKKVKRFFYEQRKLQLSILEEKLADKGLTRAPENLDDLLFDLIEQTEKLQKLMWPLYVEVANEAGKALFEEMGELAGEFSVQDSGTLAALQSKLVNLVKVNEKTRADVKEIIQDAMEKAESWQTMAQRIRDKFNDFTDTRSWTIARTETSQCMGMARHQGMKSLEVEKIQWVTAGDERVRPRHRLLMGAVVVLGQLFINGCLYPADPKGPADEIINCRCCARPYLEKN
jgi:HK97 family phage portal protein